MQESSHPHQNGLVKNIKESEEYKSFIKEHLPSKIEREKRAKELLLEYRGKYTEEILDKVFDTVDPKRTWFGSTLAKMNVDLIFKHGASDIDHWINLLLFSNEDLYSRLDKCLTEFKMKGANKGIATLFLYLLNPAKYNIWNNATESGLKKMGLLVNFRGKDIANKYKIINEAAIEFRNSNKLVPQEIDWFLSSISRSKSEKQS